MKSGDFVLIVDGVDDVFDGQICKVMSDDETASPHEYLLKDPICVLCWTGFLTWTTQDNLIPVGVENHLIEQLFELGLSRHNSARVSF